MDEEMEYAEMLEIPVSTIDVKKKRGRKPKKAQDLKEEVISKVNEETKATKTKRSRKPAAKKTASSEGIEKPAAKKTAPVEQPTAETTSITDTLAAKESTVAVETAEIDLPSTPMEDAVPAPIVEESIPVAIPRRRKRPFFARLFGKKESAWEFEEIDTLPAFTPTQGEFSKTDDEDTASEESLPIYNYGLYENTENNEQQRRSKRNALIVGIEFAACFALCLGIFLTNVFMPNSAINVFFRSLGDTQQTDSRTYADFKLSAILSEEDAALTLSPSGILSFREEGCVYPAVDGKVETVVQNSDGTWTVKISHSDTFSEIISGLSYAACSVGSLVRSNVPVGYSDGNAEVQVSMYESGALLNCFTLTENGELVWAE